MTSDRLSLRALLVSRMYLYESFHKILGGLLTQELAEVLVSRDTYEVIDEFAGPSESLREFQELLSALAGTSDEAQEMQAFISRAHGEYTRLFYGPFDIEAYPFETAYREQDPVLLSSNTLAVRHAYAEYGFECAKKGQIAEDHLAIMCDFQARLSEAAYECFKEGRLDALSEILRSQYAFIVEHMANWIPEFVTLLRAADGSGIYVLVVSALSEFVLIDSGFINEAMKWVEEEPRASTGLMDDEDGAQSAEDMFSSIEATYRTLKGMRLRGLEENELCRIRS